MGAKRNARKSKKKGGKKITKKTKQQPHDSDLEYLGSVDKQAVEKTSPEEDLSEELNDKGDDEEVHQLQNEEDLREKVDDKDDDADMPPLQNERVDYKDDDEDIPPLQNENVNDKDADEDLLQKQHEEDQEKDLQEEEEDKLAEQPKRKKHRGPTRMKNIARDPNSREKVDFTDMGEAIGPGSVKLSSYLGPLVREHVPVTVDDWRKISEEVKTILWRSVQARFELDEEYQKNAVMKQMGCLWRASKSRLVTQIRSKATNQERMNLRPKNVTPTEWRKFVKLKTSPAFKIVSDQYKERRSKQIPHTCSRKGMVRLADDLKKASGEPSDVTRLKIWVKSRTRKDGTPVNTNAAEKFKKVAELVDHDEPSSSTNPKEDLLTKVLGAENPGRLRVMGRSMSATKLACFQVKRKLIADLEEKQIGLIHTVNELKNEVARLKQQSEEPDIGENSAAARSVNKRSEPKCVLVDWSGSGENVAEGRLISSDPDEFVNNIPLGPLAVKVLIETAVKLDAFLWRPAPEMFIFEQAVGQIIAWPASNCILLESELQPDEIMPKSPTSDSFNKCKLLAWSVNDEVVAEGRWKSKEPKAMVNGLPLGPSAVKVFVDKVLEPDTFLWRPTSDVKYMKDTLMSFVAWPANRVLYDCQVTPHQSPIQNSKGTQQQIISNSAQGTKTPTTNSVPLMLKTTPASCSRSVVKNTTQTPSQSPLRRSQRKNPEEAPKPNQKCRLMSIAGKKQVVAEGRWASDDPDQRVHFVPLGHDAVRVWVDIVKVNKAPVWRPSEEIEFMEDAIGSSIAWPKEKVIMC